VHAQLLDEEVLDPSEGTSYKGRFITPSYSGDDKAATKQFKG
jgi:hypothetical protein